MATFDQRGQIVDVQANVAGNMYIYAQATPRPVDPDVLATAEQQLAALPLDIIPAPAPLPEGSCIPFCPNPLFVGRGTELRRMAQVLKGNGIAAIGQIAAATGLGGLGKTQLAIEFAHRYGQYFEGGVFWLNCASPETIPHEVAACGGVGGMQLHPDFHALPLEEQVRGVQRAWQSPLPRLLVFDNCEHQELITRWRPVSGGCRVLITSRRASWEASLGLATLALDVLPRAESLVLLHQFRPDLAVGDPDIDEIAAELGDLPLALHLAGSFLARYRQAVTPTAYLAQLRQPNLLEHPSLQGWQLTRDLSPTQHEQHVARTFKLSYDRLDPTDPTDASTLALLARAAHFAPGQPIPRDLILATVMGPEEASIAALQTEDALGRLLDLGLLESDTTGAIRLHRLVAGFVQKLCDTSDAQAAVEEALLTEASRVNQTGDPRPLLAWQVHLRAVAAAAQPREDERAADLCYELGYHLRQLRVYDDAHAYYQRARAIYEQVLGAEHPKVAVSLTSLAELACAQGAYAQAAADCQRALAINQKTSNLPAVAASLNTLAGIYYAQTRYTEAEKHWHRVLQLRQAQYGEHHPAVAAVLNHLGELSRVQGDYRSAERYHRKALAIRRTTSPEHPDLAQSLNHLAGLYYDQGEAAQAESLYIQALDILQHTLGEEHPEVANIRSNLALVAYVQGNHSTAEKYGLEACKILQQALGLQHPDTQAVQARLKCIWEA